MGLLQKKPLVTSSLPLYTISGGNTFLIVGLGNVGKDYVITRHNAGFLAVDDFASKNEYPAWSEKKDLFCHICTANLGPNKVILIKPTTLMNDSGRAVQAVQHYFKLDNSKTVVLYDELALKFGQVRARVGGETAGHNGIKSIVNTCGEDFGRIRIGIANSYSDKADAGDFVLSKFSAEEQEQLPAILREAGVMLTEYIFGGSLPHETRNAI